MFEPQSLQAETAAKISSVLSFAELIPTQIRVLHSYPSYLISSDKGKLFGVQILK